MTIAEDCRKESLEQTDTHTKRQQVLKVFQDNGALSSWEVARILNWDVYTVRPRITELVQAMRLHEVGKKFYAPTQRNETVYAIEPIRFDQNGQGAFL